MLRAEFEISGILFAIAYVLLLQIHWVYIAAKLAYAFCLLFIIRAPLNEKNKNRAYIALTIALCIVCTLLFFLGYR